VSLLVNLFISPPTLGMLNLREVVVSGEVVRLKK